MTEEIKQSNTHNRGQEQNTSSEPQQPTPQAQRQNQKVQPESQPKQKKKQQSAQSVNGGSREGFNLIPAMTKEEKVHVKKKNTLNIGSILSLIFLAVIALAIVGFNITAKTQLNRRKSALSKIESSVSSDIDKIASNNVILDRVKLYLDVQSSNFSHRKIIEFFTEMTERVGGISYDSIEISESLRFEIHGSASSLERLANLWYIFGVDENIEEITLDSVGKNEKGASFGFEGTLLLENFSKD